MLSFNFIIYFMCVSACTCVCVPLVCLVPPEARLEPLESQMIVSHHEGVETKYVCVRTCVCAHMCVRTCVCARTCVRTRVYMCSFAQVRVHATVCVEVREQPLGDRSLFLESRAGSQVVIHGN